MPKVTLAHEVNFDGLVGPTHNYAGLSSGNLASTSHSGKPSNPRAAALQGIAKMRKLVALGVQQAILPPHPRPDLGFARRLGFSGSDRQLVDQLARSQPRLLAHLYSASPMWTANSGTFSSSSDCSDHKAHLTCANLVSKLHRSIEPEFTKRVFDTVFGAALTVHPALPAHLHFGDEGAANHERMGLEFGGPGVELFVWGRSAFQPASQPRKFEARQTLEASEALIRQHRLPETQVVLAQQSARAIDAGAFHNDVVCVAHRDLIFLHESAFENQSHVLEALQEKFRSISGGKLRVVQVSESQLSLEEAIQSYIFNSQIVTSRDKKRVLIATSESHENPRAQRAIEQAECDQVEYLDFKESMRNGGGPACLRLRVLLTEGELAKIAPGVLMDPGKLDKLEAWVKQNYRDKIESKDLGDFALAEESRRALESLQSVLGLPKLYS